MFEKSVTSVMFVHFSSDNDKKNILFSVLSGTHKPRQPWGQLGLCYASNWQFSYMGGYLSCFDPPPLLLPLPATLHPPPQLLLPILSDLLNLHSGVTDTCSIPCPRGYLPFHGRAGVWAECGGGIFSGIEIVAERSVLNTVLYTEWGNYIPTHLSPNVRKFP